MTPLAILVLIASILRTAGNAAGGIDKMIELTETLIVIIRAHKAAGKGDRDALGAEHQAQVDRLLAWHQAPSNDAAAAFLGR